MNELDFSGILANTSYLCYVLIKKILKMDRPGSNTDTPMFEWMNIHPVIIVIHVSSSFLCFFWPRPPCCPPENHYKEKLQRRCCKDGLRDVPMPYSCTRRSLYVTEGLECMQAFRYCCAFYRGQGFDAVFPTMFPTTTAPTTTAAPTTSSVTRSLWPIYFSERLPLSRHMFGN